MLRSPAVALGLLAAAAAGFFGYRLWDRLWVGSVPAGATAAPRPDFTLPDLSGTPQPVAQWDGQVLVVNFWATWCEPCRREIPLLHALQLEYGGRGVQVVGVAIDALEEVRRYAEGLEIGYPLLVGEQDAIDALAAFGAEMTVLPYTAFVGRDGRIAALHAGEITREQAVALLAPLL